MPYRKKALHTTVFITLAGSKKILHQQVYMLLSIEFTSCSLLAKERNLDVQVEILEVILSNRGLQSLSFSFPEIMGTPYVLQEEYPI